MWQAESHLLNQIFKISINVGKKTRPMGAMLFDIS